MALALSCRPNPTCDTSVDYLNLDGIFVKDIKSNPSDCAIVKSINEIGVYFAKGYGIEKKRRIVEWLA